MTRDDRLRQAFQDLASQVEGHVSAPPAADVLHRAGVRPKPRREGSSKPFPFAGIVGVAALPFVAIGAVLVYPAGAEVLLGGDDDPTPVVETTTESATPTTPAPDAAVVDESPSDPTPTGTGAQAVAPLVEVTVVLTDETVAGDGCRRLTERSRFVPEASPISGTIEALLAGPLDDERAVGLSSSLPPGAATADVDPDTRTVTIDVRDRGTWQDDCGQAEFQEALFRTVAQFEGWSARLSIAGEVVGASPSPTPEPDPTGDGAGSQGQQQGEDDDE